MINNFKHIRDLKAGSVFLVEDEQGKQFVLKQSPAASRVVKFSFLLKQRSEVLQDLVPEFYGQDDWLWQKFLTWDLAGDTVQSYGIKNEAFEFLNPEKVGQAIAELQGLPFTDGGMETRLSSFYLKNIAEFRPALEEEFSPDFARSVEQFLLSKKELVDKDSHFLANGDLHPQNIMYQNYHFRLIDWDLLHFNNAGWDLTDLFVWGWRSSKWGVELLNSYREAVLTPTTAFEKIFAFDVVYLSSQLVKHAKIVNLPQDFLEAQKKILLTFLG
jgi:aminoglycoside phosphotransferase (APT) family kinase protein